MRELSELLNTVEPAWPQVQDWMREARNPVEVLPATDPDRADALVATQVTTRSPMGAIIYETGGILIDGGWLRLLGSGHPRLPRSLPEWNVGRTSKEPGDPRYFLLVADDAVGGFFAINGGGLGPEIGNVFYHAPDTLEWEDLNRGYTDFVYWCFTGDLNMFYDGMRWPDWQIDLAGLAGDRAYSVYPFLFAAGPGIQERSRRAVPIAELYGLYVAEGGNADQLKQQNL